MRITAIIGSLILIATVGVGAYYFGELTTKQGQVPNVDFITPSIVYEKPCTQEAKFCPDGSTVGRTGPKCEFTQCPINPTVPPENQKLEKCVKSGCSSEMCLERSIGEKTATICLFRQEYSCLKFSSCDRQSDGRCGWTKTDDYLNCLNDLPKESM